MQRYFTGQSLKVRRLMSPLSLRISLFSIGLALLLTAAIAGCTGSSDRDRAPKSVPGFPVWSVPSVQTDLSTLSQIGRNRVPGAVAHRLAHLYLSDRLRAIGIQPAQPNYVQPWGLPPDTSLNLVGYLAGDDPSLRDTAVVLIAPFDAGVGGRNVSTAVGLELARTLAQTTRFYRYPARTLVIAFVDGDEGMRAYFRNPAWPLSATEAVVRLGGTTSSRPAALRPTTTWQALIPDASLPPDSAAIRLLTRTHGLLLPHLAAPPPAPLEMVE